MKRFSVGIWDTLFGKRVVMEIPNISGEIVRRSVTQKWLEMAQNKINTNSPGNEEIVKVHIIDGRHGYRVGYWIMGEDVGSNYANHCKDSETGELYVIHYFEDQEPKIKMLTKEQWNMAHKKLELLSSS